MDNVKKNKKKSQKNVQLQSQINEVQGTTYENQQQIEWSNDDKRALLEGLKNHGSDNITAISKLLPHIPPKAIESKISEYAKSAEFIQSQELLDQWMKCGLYKPDDSLIPEALLFIQLFEDHPSVSESEGYDFRAIYNFLYRSCFGQPSSFDLSRQSRSLLATSLSNVEKKTWPECQKDVWEYIGRVYNRKDIKKVYPGKSTHSM